MKTPKTPKPFHDQPFARRRDIWMRNLLKADLPSGAKCVGLRLALYMHGHQEEAFPSYQELGRETDLSERQVQSNVKALEEAEWLRVKHVRNRGNSYYLRYWWAE